MILYEEAQGGRVTGDLSQLLVAVGVAVQNLVQVSITNTLYIHLNHKVMHSKNYNMIILVFVVESQGSYFQNVTISSELNYTNSIQL